MTPGNPRTRIARCLRPPVTAAVQSAALEWDADEEIAVATVPVDEALALARAGF